MPETILTKEQMLDILLDKMLEGSGEQGLSLSDRAEMRLKLEQRIEDGMIQALSDEQLEELERLVDAEASDEEIDQFFADSGVDFDEAAAQAVEDFRQELFDAEAE